VRRGFWRRRPRRVDLRVRLLRIGDLFATPELDPFLEEHAGYDERPGVEQMLGALRMAHPRATATATIELPAREVTPGLDDATASAMGRYCRRKLALLDEELDGVYRFGVRALLWGLLAVAVLNGLASTIQDDLDPIASGLGVAAWVILWVPVNLLVYDRWYYKRDQRAYRALLEAPITITSEASAPAGSARP
jgi:hypothetical protein